MSYDVYQDAEGYYRWRFTNDRNQITSTSTESYRTEADCRAAISANEPLRTFADKMWSNLSKPRRIRLSVFLCHSYLHNRTDVDAYVSQREPESARIRHKTEKRFPQKGIRARLLSRR